MTSRFLRVKSTHQIRACVAHSVGILARADWAEIRGYEIHMGQTEGANLVHPFELIERSSQACAARDGSLSHDGNIMGTYIHGLFHNDRLRHAILTELASRKGRAQASHLDQSVLGLRCVVAQPGHFETLASMISGILEDAIIFEPLSEVLPNEWPER